MRLLVRMYDPRESNHGSRRSRPRRSPDQFASFETTVMKLIRGKSESVIHGYGFMPEKYAHLTDQRFYQKDGTYLFEVWINHNRTTLAPFIESGLLEMDVRETES